MKISTRTYIRALIPLATAFLCVAGAHASTLKISFGAVGRSTGEVEADYNVEHAIIDEVKGQTIPVTFFLDPQKMGVESAEIFTNLNRREFADRDANGDGIPDGIEPPSGNGIVTGNDMNYYKAYPMQLISGGYILTLNVSQCGVFRVTARYRLQGDPPGTYRWYGDEINSNGIHKRDNCIVISPPETAAMQIYEANPLTVLATGTNPEQRGTFAEMANGVGSGSAPAFSLSYIIALGCNTLWLQPIHPRGLEGRQTDSGTGQSYILGSPYSVRNYFSVMPLMARNFTPGTTPASNDTASGRTEALNEFRAFVKAANSQNIMVMLDVPFNHTAPDVELADDGSKMWGGGSADPSARIRDVQARVFSRSGEYDERASSAQEVAVAPDRDDFGKWSDVRDLFYGRYASLVPNPTEINQYKDEEDYLDYSVGSENGTGEGNGHFDRITQNLWRYFGDYVQYWLTETGYPENAAGIPLAAHVGIGGLRADFAQGLPPQSWEYIINRSRARKWDFVFMAESLDGGPVTYRSGRHFDVLNENLIYELHGDMKAADYERTYSNHDANYHHAVLLLNTSSQDEDNYKDPFDALVRYATNSTMYGATMIFPGQELGLAGTIVPPGGSNSANGKPFGYSLYESSFGGKPIPQFKTYNSMMPLWQEYESGANNSKRLHDLYEAIGIARSISPALRSGVHSFLRLENGGMQPSIFAVAKMEQRDGDPKSSDVVLAFVNLTPHQSESTQRGDGYSLNIDDDHDGKNDLGIQPGQQYNVVNLAKYEGVHVTDVSHGSQYLWSSPRTGSDLLKNGLEIQLNAVPTDHVGWGTAPYEVNFLRLVDVTHGP